MAETVNTNQFKNGMHIELDGSVWRILEFQHVKPGKGGAFVRSRLRNLDSGAVVDKTFRAGEKFPRVHTEVKDVQYLYDAGDEVVFMDNDTYEQFSLPHAAVEDALPYLEPSGSVQILWVDGRPAGVQLPSAVELAVAETDPGVRGDTVSNVTKPAKLETGAKVQDTLQKLGYASEEEIMQAVAEFYGGVIMPPPGTEFAGFNVALAIACAKEDVLAATAVEHAFGDQVMFGIGAAGNLDGFKAELPAKGQGAVPAKGRDAGCHDAEFHVSDSLCTSPNRDKAQWRRK